MISKLRKIYTDVKIKFVLKRGFSPTNDEVNKARNLFLAEVEARFPFTEQPRPSRFLQYTLAAIAGVFILNSGAVIYADTYDVPTTHPLYTYKRVAEEVKVRTASKSRQAKFEIEIAERRVKELKHIQGMYTTGTSTNTIGLATSSKASTSKNGSTRAQIKIQSNLRKHIEAVEKQFERESHTNQTVRKDIVCKELKLVRKEITRLFSTEEDIHEVKDSITKICSDNPVSPEIKKATTTSKQLEKVKLEARTPPVEFKIKAREKVIEKNENKDEVNGLEHDVKKIQQLDILSN